MQDGDFLIFVQGTWIGGNRQVSFVKLVIEVVAQTALLVKDHGGDVLRCAGQPLGKAGGRGHAGGGKADESAGHLGFQLIGNTGHVADEYLVGVVEEKGVSEQCQAGLPSSMGKTKENR